MKYAMCMQRNVYHAFAFHFRRECVDIQRAGYYPRMYFCAMHFFLSFCLSALNIFLFQPVGHCCYQFYICFISF